MKIKLAMIVGLLVVVFSGCGDDENPYTCSYCVDEPEALEANNTIGKGIYKGIVVGSSGTIRIDIDNAGAGEITGMLIIDELEIPLSTAGTYSNGFDSYFYGDMNTADDVQISFLVGGAGNYIVISDVIIPGHPNAEIQVVKELSSQLVEIFEGSLQGDDNGALNFIVTRDEEGTGEWSSLGRSDETIHYEGFLQRNGLFGGGGERSLEGRIEGDRVGGEWEDTNGDSGTWKGKRTL